VQLLEALATLRSFVAKEVVGVATAALLSQAWLGQTWADRHDHRLNGARRVQCPKQEDLLFSFWSQSCSFEVSFRLQVAVSANKTWKGAFAPDVERVVQEQIAGLTSTRQLFGL